MLVQHLQPFLDMEDDAWSLSSDFDGPSAASVGMDLVSEVLSGALDVHVTAEWDVRPLLQEEEEMPSAHFTHMQGGDMLGKRKRVHSALSSDVFAPSKRHCLAPEAAECAIDAPGAPSSMLGLCPLALETDIEEIQGEMAALDEHKRFLTSAAPSLGSAPAASPAVPAPVAAKADPAPSQSARPLTHHAPAPSRDHAQPSGRAAKSSAAGATLSPHASVDCLEVPEGKSRRHVLIAEAATLDERCRREAVRAALRTESDLSEAVESRLLHVSEKQFTKFVDSLVVCRSVQDPCPHTCGRKKCKPSGKRKHKKAARATSAAEMAAVFEKEEVLTLSAVDEEDEIVDIVDC